MAFATQVDVANRALQHLGIPRITAFTDSSKQAKEIGFCYDKIRRAELRRSVWTFATRRSVLRPLISTSRLVTFSVYSAATTYAVGDVVQTSDGYLWLSVGAPLAITPGGEGVSPNWIPYFGPVVAQAWDATISYYAGDVVWVSTAAYIATAPSLNHTPPNATYWHVIVGATVSVAPILYPVGVNPDGTMRNIYYLPANFLRIAPQDPKAAAVVRLGVTAGMQYNDWEIEGNLLSTAQVSPIIFRFVADHTSPSLMDDLFNEVWAAHIAAELCETMTQSHEKLVDMQGIWKDYLAIAKLTTSIEGGSTEDEVQEGGLSAPGGQPAGR